MRTVTRPRYDPDLRAAIWKRDGGVCGFCLTPTDPEAFDIDHVVGRAEGGSNDVGNLRTAHPRCNRKAGLQVRTRVAQLRQRGDLPPLTYKTMRVVLPPHLHAQLVKMADRDMRSLHAEILWLLTQAAEREQDPREYLSKHMGQDPATPLDLPR